MELITGSGVLPVNEHGKLGELAWIQSIAVYNIINTSANNVQSRFRYFILDDGLKWLESMHTLISPVQSVVVFDWYNYINRWCGKTDYANADNVYADVTDGNKKI